VEPGRRHETDEISIRLQIHDHRRMGERSFPPGQLSGWPSRRKEAVLRQPRGPRKFGWRNTEAGARARGATGIAASKMLRVPEAGVKGRVPEAAEDPLLGGFPSPSEKQAKEADRGDQVGHTGVHRCLRPRSGCRILRSNGECCRDPRGRYRLPRRGLPPTPRPRLARAVGTGEGRIGAGKAGEEQSGLSSHLDSPFPAQEGCQDHCSQQGQWSRCRNWPS
jgi:hypothetical protein